MAANAAPAATCSLHKEQKGLPLTAARAMGLDVAAKMLGGNRKLGDILSISDRAVAYKAEGARGIADDELVVTAAALDGRADRLARHAAKLRDEVAGTDGFRHQDDPRLERIGRLVFRQQYGGEFTGGSVVAAASVTNAPPDLRPRRAVAAADEILSAIDRTPLRPREITDTIADLYHANRDFYDAPVDSPMTIVTDVLEAVARTIERTRDEQPFGANMLTILAMEIRALKADRGFFGTGREYQPGERTAAVHVLLEHNVQAGIDLFELVDDIARALRLWRAPSPDGDEFSARSLPPGSTAPAIPQTGGPP